ncbi:hypothetical protein [Streptomyces sp. NPDC096339]|uniref:hypothetical protein n=1 Tax=Streptomyces sp. NPDC096339 TaxID=3366086 RepID=UPI00380F428E
MSVPGTPLLDFSKWGFLSAPLAELLERLGARIVEVPVDDDHFHGGCMDRGGSLVIVLPERMSALEKDLSARGLLAYRFDVDTSNWPTGATFSDLADLEHAA